MYEYLFEPLLKKSIIFFDELNIKDNSLILSTIFFDCALNDIISHFSLLSKMRVRVLSGRSRSWHTPFLKTHRFPKSLGCPGVDVGVFYQQQGSKTHLFDYFFGFLFLGFFRPLGLDLDPLNLARWNLTHGT